MQRPIRQSPCREKQELFYLPKVFNKKVQQGLQVSAYGVEESSSFSQDKTSTVPRRAVSTACPYWAHTHTHTRHTSSIVPSAIFPFPSESSVHCIRALIRFHCALSLCPCVLINYFPPFLWTQVPPHTIPLNESTWGQRFYTLPHVVNKLPLHHVGNGACMCVHVNNEPQCLQV